MMANLSPGCEPEVILVSPSADVIVAPLTDVITSPLARPPAAAGAFG